MSIWYSSSLTSEATALGESMKTTEAQIKDWSGQRNWIPSQENPAAIILEVCMTVQQITNTPYYEFETLYEISNTECRHGKQSVVAQIRHTIDTCICKQVASISRLLGEDYLEINGRASLRIAKIQKEKQNCPQTFLDPRQITSFFGRQTSFASKCVLVPHIDVTSFIDLPSETCRDLSKL